MRPVIGITPDVGVTSPRPGRPQVMRYELKQAYADAVLAAGGLPIILPYSEDEDAPAQVVSICDGVAVLRVYEAAGRPAAGVTVKLRAKVASARIVNLLEDPERGRIRVGAQAASSSLRLPERELSAFWAGDDATPSRRPLARLEQDRGAEQACAFGALLDPIDLDVGQPQRPPGGAFDDTPAEAAARIEREI